MYQAGLSSLFNFRLDHLEDSDIKIHTLLSNSNFEIDGTDRLNQIDSISKLNAYLKYNVLLQLNKDFVLGSLCCRVASPTSVGKRLRAAATACLDARIGPTSRVSFGLDARRREQGKPTLRGAVS